MRRKKNKQMEGQMSIFDMFSSVIENTKTEEENVTVSEGGIAAADITAVETGTQTSIFDLFSTDEQDTQKQEKKPKKNFFHRTIQFAKSLEDKWKNKAETANQLWNTKKSMKTNKTKPIPEDVFDKILYHAVHDEKDVLTKSGIIIQSQTGLRINEVLSIQEGCVKRTFDGYDYMEVTLGKTEKGEPIIHKVFINELVKDTIKELSDFTEPLRKESGLKELFLCKSAKKKNAINVYSLEHWNDQKLMPFIKRWDIRGNKGELYPLTSHQFRATFVRELIKRKVPIAMIMKQYSHVSIEMTAHYLTLQEEEVKEIYSDMILSPESKIAGLRAKEIKGKLDDLFHGKTEDEIDDVITDLAKTMSFNPLPTGVCLYDFRRGNCTDGDGCFFYNCPNYITEVQFYPILKDELDLLEKEMARLKELGHEREWQKQYIKYKYLKPLVESLEVQLNGKESVG